MIKSIVSILLLSLILLLGENLTLNAQFAFNVKRTFTETSHQIFFSGFSSDGKYIVTIGSDNSIIIWIAESGIIYRTLIGTKKRPNIALYSSEKNILISGGEDNVVTLWNPATLKIVSTLTGHQGPVKSLDISPDGNYLATGSTDKTIRIWEISSGNLIYELKGHKKDVNSVQFSPDGKKLISGSADGTVIIWSLLNGNIVSTKEAHKGWVRCVRFSPDGSLIASCGDDNLIRIWNVSDMNINSTLKGHHDWVQSVDFTPDGKNLISGGHDQLIILWEIVSGKILYQSEKQGQIVLSVDISPKQPDFISSILLSEDLKIWALSGLDEAQWNNVKPTSSAETEIAEIKTEKPVEQQPENPPIIEEFPDAYPQIEIYAPALINNSVIHDQAEILMIGRVNDPDGIYSFYINKNSVILSEAGVFQYNLKLTKGINIVELIALNKSGKTNKRKFTVDCRAQFAVSEKTEIPDIQKGKYYALIIGIDKYKDEGITDLDYPIYDAEALYNVLLSGYTFEKENITFLKNPELDEMILALDELGRKLTMNDNLLIFYAGHGHWDDKSKLGYWLPSDAEMYNTVKWFRNSTLRDFIGSIQTRHTFLIADACFSGAIFKTRAAFTAPSQGIEKLYELPSRKAMTSGILQEVPDESIFIKYLIKRLEENKEKYLSAEDLFSSFKTAVMNNSTNVPQFGTIQNVGDEGGDFIFITR